MGTGVSLCMFLGVLNQHGAKTTGKSQFLIILKTDILFLLHCKKQAMDLVACSNIDGSQRCLLIYVLTLFLLLPLSG